MSKKASKDSKLFSQDTLKLAKKFQKELSKNKNVQVDEAFDNYDDEDELEVDYKDFEEEDNDHSVDDDQDEYEQDEDDQAEEEEIEEEEDEQEQEEQANDDDEDALDDIEENEEEQDEIAEDYDQKDDNSNPENGAKPAFNAEPDITILQMKIQDILQVLKNFKENNESNRTRQSYMDELSDLFCSYYGYNKDLMSLFQSMLTGNELHELLEANEKQRPTTIRTNTLKTRRKELAQTLIQRGVSLDSVGDWNKVGLKIYESKVPIGATPEYLAGHYMLQSAASFLPVMALAPQMNERILDMAAAPGGKTSYIAQLMKNSGVLFANDASKTRIKALHYNLQRMGVTNSIVCNYDGRKFSKVMKNFDRVMLDAPCTGVGIIARDPSIKGSKMLRDVKIAAHLQKELILSAIDCTKKGGYIVYSTCSILINENEWVVDYALRNRHVKVVETGLMIGEDGITKYEERRFDQSIKLTKRLFPHIHNMDGFYVAKLKKIADGPKKIIDKKVVTEKVVTKKDKRRNRNEMRIKKKAVRVAAEAVALSRAPKDTPVEETVVAPKGRKAHKAVEEGLVVSEIPKIPKVKVNAQVVKKVLPKKYELAQPAPQKKRRVNPK